MEVFHMYPWIFSVLVAVTAVQVHNLDTDNHELKHRLADLEATVLRLVERNIDLEGRNNIITERNNRFEERNNRLEKRVSALETEIKAFRNEPQKKVTDFKRQSSIIETVAFTAVVHPMELQNLGAGQTIIYDKIITNVGGAYHNHTGVFTAPFNGVYVFNFAEMITAGNNEYLLLTKNGQTVMSNYANALGVKHLMSSSRTSTLELKAGDEVWVRTSPSSIHGTGELHGNGYTTFSGWIVYIA